MSVRHLIATVAVAGLVCATCGGDATDQSAPPASPGDVPEVDDPTTATDTTATDTTATDTTATDTSTNGTSADGSAPAPTSSIPLEPATQEAGDVAVTVYTSADGLTDDRVGAVDVGADGTVWAATEVEPGDAMGPSAQSFARLDGRAFVAVGTPDRALLDGDEQLGTGDDVFGMDMSGGPDGTLWIASTWFGSVGDVYHYDGTRWSSPVTSRAALLRGVAAPDGSLWSISMAGATVDEDDEVIGIALARVDDDGAEVVAPPPGGIPCGFCVELDVDSSGSLWASTSEATFRREGDEWVALTVDVPRLEDVDGGVGTRWALGRDDSHWFVRSGPDGYELTRAFGDEVAVLAIDPDPLDVDAACAATAYGVELDEVTDRVAEEIASSGLGPVRFVGDAAGRAWVGLPCVGVFRIDVETGDVLRIGLEDGLPSLAIRDLDAHPDGSVWVATDAGLARVLVTG